MVESPSEIPEGDAGVPVPTFPPKTTSPPSAQAHVEPQDTSKDSCYYCYLWIGLYTQKLKSKPKIDCLQPHHSTALLLPLPPLEDVMQPKAPVATPCRSLGSGDDIQVPDINDTQERPRAGKLRISKEAVNARLRRIFTPNVSGQYKLSTEIVQQWKSKKGRTGLEQLFQSVGYNADTWIRTIMFHF